MTRSTRRTAETRHRLPALGLAAATALAAVTLAPLAAGAATPDSGTVSPASPSLAWAGLAFVAGGTVTPTADPTVACPPAATDPANAVCDYFTLDVDVPADFYATASSGTVVSISWADALNDFDLFVYDEDNELVASSAQGGTTEEIAVIPNAAGTYEVRVAPFTVVDSDYAGTVDFTVQGGGTGGGGTGGGGPVVFAPAGPTTFTAPVVSANPDLEPLGTEVAPVAPPLLFKTTAVGRDSAEPTIGVDKEGNAFYAASTFDSAVGQARTEIKRSTDGNATWTDVTPEVAGQGTHPQTLDPYVYVEEDSGRVYDLDLLVAGSQISYSDDQGESWTTSTTATAAAGAVNDHQTLYSGPVPDGALVTTVGVDEILYYCFNRIADARCTRSLDGGLTFVDTATPAFTGADPLYPGQVCGGLHGHISTSPVTGRLFLPKGHCGQPWVAYSDDAGDTWTRVKVSDTVSMLDNQSSIDVDAAGNVYYVWYDGKHQLPYLAVSVNGGQSFGPAMMIAPPGVKEVNWPTIAAGDSGRIAVTFPGTTVGGPVVNGIEQDSTDLSRPWNTYVVVSTNATESTPVFQSNITNPVGDPIHRGDCNGRCGGMLDFLDLIVAPSDPGEVWGASVDTCTDEMSCRTVPGQGLSGETADGVAVDMVGLAYRQISGPALRGELVDGPTPVVPEAPVAVLLPLLTVALAGGFLVSRRRRTA